MKLMFERQEEYFTNERCERVRYCSCHENIKFVSSSQRVMFLLLYGDQIFKIVDFIVFQRSQVTSFTDTGGLRRKKIASSAKDIERLNPIKKSSAR